MRLLSDFQAVLDRIGVSIPKNAKILDFGCGAGAAVYALLDQGYSNVSGYDVSDYVKLRHPADRSRFHHTSPLELRLPFDDNTFDLILSDQVFEHVMDQVSVFRELYRVTRPGGHALHVIPARYMPTEGHMYVPFGSIFPHRWWFKLWALMGVRNEFQKGLSANETADRNAFYYVEALNYVTSSCYKVVWGKLGFRYKWVTQEVFDSHARIGGRIIGRLNRIFPIIGCLYRIFRARYVYLQKAEV